ncbi:putative lactoylglutathione lyase [Trifolium repens]|nr:putative lactoylglutathione lyase [Trifolium repens]
MGRKVSLSDCFSSIVMIQSKDGTTMDQLFFNDSDGFMVEICNCENLKLIPANSRGKIKLPMDRHTPPVETDNQNEHDS